MTVLLSSVGVTSKTNFSTPQRGRNSRFIRGVPGTADNSVRRGGEITRVSGTSTSFPHKYTTINNKAIESSEGLGIVLLLVVECNLESRVVPVPVVTAEVEGGGTGRARGQGFGWEVCETET